MMQWQEGIITDIEVLSPTTKQLRVAVQSDAPLTYRAGQFVVMDLPIGEKRLQRWRSYSIANAPTGNNELEFCISRVPNGLASRYLLEEATVGTTLKFKSPDGGFVLPDTLDHDIVMLCTGTGIAPFRSMLQDIFLHQKPHRRIHLIFGTPYASHILYRQEMQTFAERQPLFSYDVALSRETDWQGHKGHIHAIYEKAYATPRPDVHFYICGWSNMIDQAVAKLLIDLRYDKSQIHYELYG